MNETFFCNKCGAQNVAGAQFCVRCGAPTGPTPGVVPTAVASPNLAPSYPASATFYRAVVPAVAVGYGGFWIRVVAAIIDGIILRLVVSPIRMIFGSWLYEAFMESSSYQATLGKMIFGMKVTDLNGNRISFERATGRHFAKWLSTMILGIGYIMVGFTERKQGLHDLLAGTLVRRG